MRIDGETHRHAKRIGAAVARGKGFGTTPELEDYLESDPERIMAALEGFALHVRLENESSYALACGFLQLIEMRLQRLRYEQDCGYDWARTLIERFQQEVAERVRRRSLKGTGLSMIGGALKEAGLAPIEALIAASFEEMQSREDEQTSDLEASANLSLAELVEQTGGDSFAINRVLAETTAPSDARVEVDHGPALGRIFNRRGARGRCAGIARPGSSTAARRGAIAGG